MWNGDGPLLAICGRLQILGRQWLWGDELVPGLGLIDMETRRPGTSADRLIDNMVLESPLATHPVVGYENHAGRTYLGEGVEGFGRVVSSCGHGNNDDDRVEGARYKNVVGTIPTGRLLSKNPEVATGCSPALSNAVRSAPEPRPPISLLLMIAPSSPPTPPWSSACRRRRFNADAPARRIRGEVVGNLPFFYGFSLVMGPILLRRSAILCQNVTSN